MKWPIVCRYENVNQRSATHVFLDVPVFIAAENAVQLPVPVKNEKKLRTPTLTEPGPASYAA